MTAIATVVFLISKFLDGAWVVVVAVPSFVVLFRRIHAYYGRAGRELGFGETPAHPEGKPSFIIVPVNAVSRLTEHAIAEALSLGGQVQAVTVIQDSAGADDPRSQTMQREWQEWSPGVPLEILHTEYASVVDPLVSYIDGQRARDDRQIVVLIPVIIPDRVRYRILHNQIDLVLSAALRSRTDVVVARVQMPLEALAAEANPN